MPAKSRALCFLPRDHTTTASVLVPSAVFLISPAAWYWTLTASALLVIAMRFMAWGVHEEIERANSTANKRVE